MNFKRFWNLAIAVFVLLLVGVILISLFRIKNTSGEVGNSANQSFQFRVLGLKQDFFNRTYWYAFWNSGIWLVDSKDSLKIGKEYQVKGEIQIFSSEDKKNLFELSSGVVGKMVVQKLVATNLNCDFICQSFSFVDEQKRKLANHYLYSFCHTWYWLNSFLAPGVDCKDVGGLSVGLVLGGGDQFTKEMKDNFKKVGIIHIVVVSGFQVGLLASLLEIVALSLGVGRRIRFGLFGLAFIIMVLVVGPQPPVLRSITSFLLSSGSLFFLGRRLENYRSLGFSAIVMLLVQPFYILSISFQLSFLASLGLVFSLKNDLFQLSWLKNIQELIISTLATFLFTLPIIVNLAGAVSLISLGINVLILPFIPIVTALNFLGILPIIGELFLGLASILQALILFLVNDLSKISSPFELSEFGMVEIVGYYSILSLIFLFLNFWSGKVKSSTTAETV